MLKLFLAMYKGVPRRNGCLPKWNGTIEVQKIDSVPSELAIKSVTFKTKYKF